MLLHLLKHFFIIKLNILIDQDGRARLADFGLLTIVLDSTYHTSSNTLKSAGTVRWMSPELLDPERFGLGDGRPTKCSDTYALGMVILEVLTGKPPFLNCNWMVVMRKVVEGEHPGRPQGGEGMWFTNDLWEMLEQCWLPQPGRRPTIDALIRCLEQGSMAWQPLPPDLVQSEGDDRPHFTSDHTLDHDPSMFLHVLNFIHPQMAFVADRIGSRDDGRTPVLSPNPPRTVSVVSDVVDAFVL